MDINEGMTTSSVIEVVGESYMPNAVRKHRQSVHMVLKPSRKLVMADANLFASLI